MAVGGRLRRSRGFHPASDWRARPRGRSRGGGSWGRSRSVPRRGTARAGSCWGCSRGLLGCHVGRLIPEILRDLEAWWRDGWPLGHGDWLLRALRVRQIGANQVLLGWHPRPHPRHHECPLHLARGTREPSWRLVPRCPPPGHAPPTSPGRHARPAGSAYPAHRATRNRHDAVHLLLALRAASPLVQRLLCRRRATATSARRPAPAFLLGPAGGPASGLAALPPARSRGTASAASSCPAVWVPPRRLARGAAARAARPGGRGGPVVGHGRPPLVFLAGLRQKMPQSPPSSSSAGGPGRHSSPPSSSRAPPPAKSRPGAPTSCGTAIAPTTCPGSTTGPGTSRTIADPGIGRPGTPASSSSPAPCAAPAPPRSSEKAGGARIPPSHCGGSCLLHHLRGRRRGTTGPSLCTQTKATLRARWVLRHVCCQHKRDVSPGGAQFLQNCDTHDRESRVVKKKKKREWGRRGPHPFTDL